MFKKYRIVSKVRFSLFIIVALVVIIGSMSMFFRPTYVSGSTEMVYETVVVKSGETLWEIASRYIDDKTDIRMFIYDISKINNLTDSQIVSGQEILIPMF
ncbi:MAG: LysM peptidoglycan-binding domain-containing protein [Firmicutes bacterium]|nr:LysM peptidoglycan-binding domain-containing protein [Bacillota bacterium]